MRSTSSEAPGPVLVAHWARWWQQRRQRAAQARCPTTWSRTLSANAQHWQRCAQERQDPFPGTRLPDWAQALLTETASTLTPSTAELLHGGLIGVWRKHREDFQMIGGGQAFLDTLDWANDRDQGPVWDVRPLTGDSTEAAVLRWAQDVEQRHQTTLFTAPLDWFVPNPQAHLRATYQVLPGRSEHRLPDASHDAWRQGLLPVLDGANGSTTPLKALALSGDEWPVVVVRWNPIALAVMTGRWDRVNDWSERAPQAAQDAQHLLVTMGKTPTPARPQDQVAWERWVLKDLIHTPSSSVTPARARL